ncbi:MAG TPA: glycoside hydrolase family 43 protein [Chloroflexota bacterium]|nr:glycoside hydrolase family 43 protein [Chloroflexota bacterium]
MKRKITQPGQRPALLVSAFLLLVLVVGIGVGARVWPRLEAGLPGGAPLQATGQPGWPTAVPTPGPAQFANPVIDRDFPDPDSLRVGDVYYAYATNTRGANVQLARSKDLVRWERLGDALPTLPPWSRPGFTWAPEVTAAGEGYVMYFTARHAASGRQCIGAATSATPLGPFAPRGEEPLVCQLDQGGSIDASSFVDEDGTRYLLWKNDGNCCRQDTWIYLQEVSPDGLTLTGEAVRLIRGHLAWEGFLVEAPTLWKRGPTYYLFYSANRYSGAEYAVGYATAEAVLGPYRKSGEPMLATSTERGPVIGPGGQDVVATGDGRTWLLYHSWEPTSSAYRGLSLDELEWMDEVPVVRGTNRRPQRRPLP